MFKECAQRRIDTYAEFECLPQVDDTHVPFCAGKPDVDVHWWQTLVLCRELGRVSSWLAGPSALGSLVDEEMWQTASNWRPKFSPLPPGTPWGLDGCGVVVMDIDRSTLITLQNQFSPGITFREAKRVRMSRKWRHLLRDSVVLTQKLLQAQYISPSHAAHNCPITSSRPVVYCPKGWGVKGSATHLTPDEDLFSFLMEMRRCSFAPPNWKSVQRRLDVIKEDMRMIVAEGRQSQFDRLKRDWLPSPALD